MSEVKDVENEKTSAESMNEHHENIKKIEPPSQTLLDLEASGLTPEDMAEAARSAAAEAEKKSHPDPLPSAALPRFHWLVLLLLSAAGGLTLAWSSQDGQENIRLWGLAGLILLLLLISALPATRLCPRLPTRGGLAAALLSLAIFIQTLKGQPETFFQDCPASLVWAGLLTISLMWAVAAVIRKLGRRPVTALAGLLLAYTALGPVMALVGHFSQGGPALTWEGLNASPVFLTGLLPWFLWPSALTLGLALPLAAFLALGDQYSCLRRPGARHGGNFFLALAWLGLVPSGFLLFSPATEHYPDLVQKLRDLAPVLAGIEPAPSSIPPVALKPAKAVRSTPGTEAVPAEPQPPSAPDALILTESTPPPVTVEALSTEAPPAPAEPAPQPVSDEISSATAPDDLAARLEGLQRRNETLELRVDDLEGRLQLLSDRLNQMERPEQPRSLTPPFPPELETPQNLTAPDQPLPAPPAEGDNEWEKSYYGGSAT